MKKTVLFRKIKVMEKFLPPFVVVFLMFVLVSCSTTMTQSQILSTDYAPSEDGGYIYGLFKSTSTDEGYMIGVVVQNLDTSQKYNFVLQDTPEKALQMAAVPVGNYRVDSIEYISPKNKIMHVLDFALPPEQYQRNFVVKLNTAIYIGDYLGSVNKSPETTEVYWSLKVPVNNYGETTAAIKEKYPLLTEPPITFVSNMKYFQQDSKNRDCNEHL